ncbi:hypothetical protein G3I19_36665, partial [Streptomyces sp. SID10853]|nr:hypothetical protein [Streptomyces sp. SID10853]
PVAAPPVDAPPAGRPSVTARSAAALSEPVPLPPDAPGADALRCTAPPATGPTGPVGGTAGGDTGPDVEGAEDAAEDDRPGPAEPPVVPGDFDSCTGGCEGEDVAPVGRRTGAPGPAALAR